MQKSWKSKLNLFIINNDGSLIKEMIKVSFHFCEQINQYWIEKYSRLISIHYSSVNLHEQQNKLLDISSLWLAKQVNAPGRTLMW